MKIKINTGSIVASPGRLLVFCLLLALMSFSVNVWADTTDTDQQADETGQV